MKKSVLILFSIIIGINLYIQAEDFNSVYNGDTIYYNITSSSSNLTVAVTYRVSSPGSYSGIVSIPDSVQYNNNYYKVTSIGMSAFHSCFALSSVTIPSSVTSIGDNAFQSCTSLSSITIPSSVTLIGYSAFTGTPYYSNMPDGLVYINNVLYKYKGTMPANTTINIQEGTVSISDVAFSSCSGLISITIPSSVTSIGNNAFQSCSGLTSIVIPSSVTSIGSSAFLACSSLVSITLPNTLTSISNTTFSYCSALTSITIPISVTSIGNEAFYNCTQLESIFSNSINPPNINSHTFYNVNKNIPLYVPCLSISSYQSASFWSEFTDIKAPIQIPTNLSLQYVSYYYVEVSWQSEEDSFEVYRNDSLIAIVNQMSYLDNDVLHGVTWYYKVRAIKDDCVSEFSDTIAILIGSGLDDISQSYIKTKLYPNPANNISKLEVEGLKSEADVLVYDMIGRVIKTYKISNQKNELDIDLTGYAKGVYSIRIMNDIVNQTKKLIVQ